MQIAVGIHQMLDFQFQVQLDCSQMLENPCDWRWPSSAVNYSASLRRAEGERPSLKEVVKVRIFQRVDEVKLLGTSQITLKIIHDPGAQNQS